MLHRDGPALVTGIIDELSLYRRVGPAETMAAQCDHLLSLASLQHVTLQVLPAIAHPANASELIIADSSAYVEHLAGGHVYTDTSVMSSLRARFEALRGEQKQLGKLMPKASHREQLLIQSYLQAKGIWPNTPADHKDFWDWLFNRRDKPAVPAEPDGTQSDTN